MTVHPRNMCDKCGERVPHENDAVVLALKIGEIHPLVAVTAQSRHLLPTGTCEGSPSRAQYIAGQPRDPRPEYPYVEANEALIRTAHQEMLAMHSAAVN